MTELIVLLGTDVPLILNLDQFMSFEYSEILIGEKDISKILTCVAPTGFTMTIKGEAASYVWAQLERIANRSPSQRGDDKSPPIIQ